MELRFICEPSPVGLDIVCPMGQPCGSLYCVDGGNTTRQFIIIDFPSTDIAMMKTDSRPAEVNIHLRARAHDRMIIDQAAELVGANRSQFMLASALKEAKNVLLDQTSLMVDNQTFQKVLDWMDAPGTPEQTEGMKRLLDLKAPW
jgi:uncharacterized protein (DUF1778 family)